MILGVPPGEHTVVAQLIGYRSVTQTVTFVAGETAALDIRLFETAVPVRGLVVTLVGAGSQTLLRGVRSTAVQNEPLLYVDGARITREEFEGMNPMDIERVEVIKGDEAVAWYGGEASVGVIKIELKHEAPEPISLDIPRQPVFGTPGFGRCSAGCRRRVQVLARLEPRPTPSRLGQLPGHVPGAVASPSAPVRSPGYTSSWKAW